MLDDNDTASSKKIGGLVGHFPLRLASRVIPELVINVLKVLREERAYEVGGAMHYFQADLQTAREAIDLGFYISLAKPLLRQLELQEVAAQLPLDHIVLETDSAPQPFKRNRDRWTEPRNLKDISEKLAQLQRRDVEEIQATTTANFKRMLGPSSLVISSLEQ